MRSIVRNGRNGGFGLFGKARHQLGRRRDAITDEQDHRPGFEATDGFLDRADGNDSDAVETQPLERVLQRLGHALDHDDDRRSARGRGAADLIFDERPAGERQQRSKTARIVLLIGSD